MSQTGFDFFGDTPLPSFAEQPAGTWSAPRFTSKQFAELFAKADASVLGIVGPGRVLLEQGIQAAKAQHAAKLAHVAPLDDEAFSLWRSSFKPSPEELAAFVGHCFTFAGTHHHGIEYKTRRETNIMTIAMFAQDVGTVIVRQWPGAGFGVDYYPWRDSFFLESYRNDLPAVAAPYSLWGGAYCADKIANSDNSTASVSTFVIEGREYINTGGFSKGDYRECKAWTFRPLADWHGPTYTYRSQCEAWDEGRKERGDQRGLLVRVRGVQCVLDGAALVFDDNATNVDFSHLDEQEDEISEEFAAIEC